MHTIINVTVVAVIREVVLVDGVLEELEDRSIFLKIGGGGRGPVKKNAAIFFFLGFGGGGGGGGGGDHGTCRSPLRSVSAHQVDKFSRFQKLSSFS
jgi:hypothetical protein